MKTQKPSHNPAKELARFTKRGIICGIGVFIIFIVIIARLFYLQIIQHRFYSTLSQKNIINIAPIKPERGLIYDRNGVLLANNVSVYSLMLIPVRVKNLKQTITLLAPIIHLTKDDIKYFYRNLKNYRRFQEVPIKNKLTETELDQFYVNQFRFPGVFVKSDEIRNYPLGNMLSEVIGYVGRINSKEFSKNDMSNYTISDEIGKAGIEVQYENLLHGAMGNQEVEINARGSIVRILNEKKATPGANIYLTIDSKLQTFAKKMLGNNSGAIVAIQPNTGQVLALVTNPSYDSNIFVNGMSNHVYHELSIAPDHPLFNRALRGLYAPGSTVKPFIAAFALDDQVITSDVKINDSGWFQLPKTDHIFHDWKKHGHGFVNITKAIIVSCDTFFYHLATAMGINRLHHALSQFGFGQKTAIDLPEERSGIVPSPDWKRDNKGESWFGGDTVLTGIGQGYMLTTPLQLAYAVSTMAERGKKVQPQLLMKVQDVDNSITDIQPILQSPVIFHSINNFEIAIRAMQGVVMNAQGTAWAFGKNASYTVAAKTGTAQVYGHNRDEEESKTNIPKKLRNNHLFICFAPIDHPQIALAVVIEHDSFSDRIARKILDFYFNELSQQEKTHAVSNK